MEVNIKEAKKKGQSAGDRSQFGSVTDRVGWSRPIHQPFKDPYHLHHVPGPGHYTSQALQSTFPADPKKKDPQKALPSAQKKKLNGVHHPALVMALQEVNGPLQAFNSTEDRPCNRPSEQATPAPWQYDKEASRDFSMAAVLKEKSKVGKRGAFGTCADRFYGSPLAGREGLPDPGMDIDERPLGSTAEPRAMFQSQTPRFRKSGGPPEDSPSAPTVRVGAIDTPAPGAYDTMVEPSYRSPFRHPRQDHLSFGSCQTRFDGEGRDVFTNMGPSRENPAPGSYNAHLSGRKRTTGGAEAKALRQPLLVGCTTEQVGPGSYGAQMETPMLKKTFNVTTAVPTLPNSARLGRERFGSLGNFEADTSVPFM